jgi:organic radical activating enzyme
VSEQFRAKGLWSIVMLELTNCCNFSCSFCPSDSMGRRKAMMSRALREKVLGELAEKEMTSTVFFHLLGEPLLYKEIFEAIRFANELGLSVSFYTNGAMLDEERTERLLDSPEKGRIVVSLQEISGNGFEKRSRGRLSWEDYLSQLENFMTRAESRGTRAEIHCLIDMRSLSWNLLKVREQQRRLQTVYDHWRHMLGERPGRRIHIHDPARVYPLGKTTTFFVKHEGTWDNRHIDDDMEVVPRDKGHCALMTDTFAVLADGTCTYCCCDYEGELNLGDANLESLEEIYFGEKATALREAERRGILTEERCRVCRGTLIYRENRRRVPQRNLFSEYYFLKDHLRRYGLLSSAKKVAENLRRRLARHR